MNTSYKELLNDISQLNVMNTHSHHLPSSKFKGIDLDGLFESSYLNWCGVELNKTRESRENFISKLRFNSYYVWLSKALQDLYEMKEPLSASNWDEYSKKIAASHQDSEYHLNMLKDKCKYEKVIVDAYWDPSTKSDQRSLLRFAYRLNIFFFGYSLSAKDHNDTNPYLSGIVTPVASLEEYVSVMKDSILNQVSHGCVALKVAIAYDRGLDFSNVSLEAAQKGYMNESATPEEINHFQNYIFYKICDIAAELDLPLQCHTGLAKLEKSSAIYLRQAIADNPNTKFVLFHGSYPWLDDLCAIVHTYANVYPDLCWVSQLSTTACERLLHELIESSQSHKICWGCDTWTSEDSYGGLLAIRHVLAKVLSEKVAYGYLTQSDALELAHCILYKNAKDLYKL